MHKMIFAEVVHVWARSFSSKYKIDKLTLCGQAIVRAPSSSFIFFGLILKEIKNLHWFVKTHLWLLPDLSDYNASSKGNHTIRDMTTISWNIQKLLKIEVFLNRLLWHLSYQYTWNGHAGACRENLVLCGWIKMEVLECDDVIDQWTSLSWSASSWAKYQHCEQKT